MGAKKDGRLNCRGLKGFFFRMKDFATTELKKKTDLSKTSTRKKPFLSSPPALKIATLGVHIPICLPGLGYASCCRVASPVMCYGVSQWPGAPGSLLEAGAVSQERFRGVVTINTAEK